MSVAGALPVDANRERVPEPGHRLFIVDFPDPPPPLENQTYAITLDYSVAAAFAPLTIKALSVAKITTGGQTYYPPLFPCATNFATLPALSLVQSSAFVQVDLAPLASAKPCKDATYVFDAGPVDVVEYRNPTLDHYFITWLPPEKANLDAGNTPTPWIRTGHSFKAYVAALTGTTPVCRYYIPPGRAIRISSVEGPRSAMPLVRRTRTSPWRSRDSYGCSYRRRAFARRGRHRSIASSAIVLTRTIAT